MSNSESKWKGVAKKAIPIVFYGLVIGFVVLYLKNVDFNSLSGLDVNWFYLLIASLLALTARYWGVFIWLKILRSLGAQNLHATGQLAYVYAKAWMGRYIPGTAPWILGKIYFASRQGISKNKLAVSSLLEAVLQITTTLAIALAMLVFDSRLDVISIELKLLMLAVLLACLVAIIPPVFNTIIKIAYRVVRKKQFPAEHFAHKKIIGQGLALYSVATIINGLAIFFAAKTIYPELDYANMLFVMGAGNLAGALGMLAVFVPSGIGVREGVQLVLFSLIMPVEIALIITVVIRLWSIVSDFMFLGISKLLSLKDKS